MLNSLLAQLMVQPLHITGVWRLLMLLPLALSISIVYKTIRCEKLQSIPTASAGLFLLIVGTMMLIGVVLLVVVQILA